MNIGTLKTTKWSRILSRTRLVVVKTRCNNCWMSSANITNPGMHHSVRQLCNTFLPSFNRHRLPFWIRGCSRPGDDRWVLGTEWRLQHEGIHQRSRWSREGESNDVVYVEKLGITARHVCREYHIPSHVDVMDEQIIIGYIWYSEFSVIIKDFCLHIITITRYVVFTLLEDKRQGTLTS
jgi:hypothetical protein